MKLERETNNNNEKLGKWGNLGRLLFPVFQLSVQLSTPVLRSGLTHAFMDSFTYLLNNRYSCRCQVMCCILGARANAGQGSSLHGVYVRTCMLSHSVVSDSLRPHGLRPARLL